MKRICLLIFILLMVCGCSNIEKKSVDDVLAQSNTSIKNTNQYRTGYKYYLPTNMSILKSEKLNEELYDGHHKYYMYVDLVSYFNKTDVTLDKDKAYYSKEFIIDNNKGFLVISVNNDKYLIEIIYNYAKIEVMVDKENINDAVTNSLIILSSIKYNDNIIDNMLGEDILNYNEEKFTIFKDTTSESNFLEYEQEYDNYNEGIEIPDYDLIN